MLPDTVALATERCNLSYNGPRLKRNPRLSRGVSGVPEVTPGALPDKCVQGFQVIIDVGVNRGLTRPQLILESLTPCGISKSKLIDSE